MFKLFVLTLLAVILTVTAIPASGLQKGATAVDDKALSYDGEAISADKTSRFYQYTPHRPSFHRPSFHKPAPHKPAPHKPAPHKPAPHKPAPYRPAPYIPRPQCSCNKYTDKYLAIKECHFKKFCKVSSCGYGCWWCCSKH